MNPRLERLLAQLESARNDFTPSAARAAEKLLRSLDAARFPDAPSLIRFHEAVMFFRAFPQGAAVLRASERILNGFHEKVEALRQRGVATDAFDPLEVSGISGTVMEDTLSFDVARWLVHHFPGQVEIAWDNYEPGRELGTTGPRFMPLLEDDSFVEADTPFRRWLETASQRIGQNSNSGAHSTGKSLAGQDETAAAKRRKNAAHGASRGYEADLIKPQRGERNSAKDAATIQWLLACFDRIPLSPLEKSELYESLRIPLRWHLGNSPLTRTRNWRKPRHIFYHRGPLITRSQVSLAGELAKRPPKLIRLSREEGERIADMIREVMLVRYRELYGTTLADPRSVVRVDLGDTTASRGLEIYLWHLPPNRRLPLRAYVAGFTLKNGVPINYIEAIGLCEWIEVGFNTFYTFRGGEAGWIYAQVLRSLCTFMGTTVVSVYPYQLGHDNDEAIESGAFWFYRKLGFRPGRPDLQKLVEQEEKKIAAPSRAAARAHQSPYRTPARTLKRLAAGHVFYELPGSEPNAWDTFSTRNLGLRVNQRMAQHFAGDAARMRAHARRKLENILGVKIENLNYREEDQSTFDNFALILADEPTLRKWSQQEKAALLQIIHAKSHPNEMLYLHLTQQHPRLRQVLLKLGSSQ